MFHSRIPDDLDEKDEVVVSEMSATSEYEGVQQLMTAVGRLKQPMPEWIAPVWWGAVAYTRRCRMPCLHAARRALAAC